jgi:hypothetical protein
MADVGSNTAITVALIAVVGTLGAAYINSSAGRTDRTPPQVVVPAAAAAPVAAGPTPGASAPPAPAATATSAAGLDMAVEQPPPVRTTSAKSDPPAPAVPLDLDGNWVDQSGIIYAVEQNGTQITVMGSGGGVMVAGRGQVDGQQIRWTYQNTVGNSGDCEARMVTPKLARATCTQAMGAPYVVLLARQS